MKALVNLYKQAYSGLSKNSWYLCIVMLINRSGTMVVPFMTIYATQKLHFSIHQAGIIMALFGAGAIAGAFLGGRITDKFGFYNMQLFALFSGGLLFMLLGFIQSFYLLAVGTFVLSLCNESFRPANAAAIAHYSTPENRTRSYSLNRLSVNLGWAVGGALGGFIASVNYELLFWVDGFTNIAAGFMLMLLLPKAKIAAPHHPKEKQQGISPYSDKPYLFFILLTILFASCFFQMFSMQPLFFKTQWHFSERFIGQLMALNGLIIALIEMVIVYKLEKKNKSISFIQIGVLLIGVGFVLQSIFPGTATTAFFVIIFITIGEIFSMPFMNAFWISRASSANRGQYAALYTIAWSVAQIAAPVIGSFIIDNYQFKLLWYVVAIICVMIIAGFHFLRKAGTKINGQR